MSSRLLAAYSPIVITLALVMGMAHSDSHGQAAQISPIRKQLIRMQRDDGLSIVTIQGNRIRAVSFADRKLQDIRQAATQGTAKEGTISADGRRLALVYCSGDAVNCGGTLAVAEADGTGIHLYANLNYGVEPCWSYDDGKLAGSWQDRRQKDPARVEGLKILDLRSESVEPVDGLDSFATTQCWSPDGKQMVYTLNKESGIQTVRLYDTTEKKSHDLADGGNATWSPDGKWIAYLHCPPELHPCEYDEIRPDGSERRRIFAVEVAEGGLFWSPDSKMGAYRRENTSPDEHPGFEQGPNELRVRLLDSGSEDWVVHFAQSDAPFFQWAKIKEMAH